MLNVISTAIQITLKQTKVCLRCAGPIDDLTLIEIGLPLVDGLIVVSAVGVFGALHFAETWLAERAWIGVADFISMDEIKIWKHEFLH